MADKDGNQLAKDYHVGVKAEQKPFHVKGMEHADWGMKDRLSRIFRPDTGNTVMLAFDQDTSWAPQRVLRGWTWSCLSWRQM